MKRPLSWILLALLLLYGGYLIWFFQIEPRRGAERILWRLQDQVFSGGNIEVNSKGEIYQLYSGGLRLLGPGGAEIWNSATLAATSALAAANQTLFTPIAFARHGDGGVYLLETGFTVNTTLPQSNARLRRLDQLGQQLWAVPCNTSGVPTSQGELQSFSGGVAGFYDTGQIEVYDEQGAQLSSFSPIGFGPGYSRFSADGQGWELSPLGQIYVAVPGTGLQAYDTAGKLLWEHKDSGSHMQGAVVRAASGTIYYANDSEVYAFDAAGRQLWKTAVAVLQGPGYLSCTSDERLLCFDRNFELMLLDNAGLVSPVKRSGPVGAISMFSLDDQDRIYCCDSNRGLQCLDLSGAELWHVSELRSAALPPVIGDDGKLYVSDGSAIYCIRR